MPKAGFEGDDTEMELKKVLLSENMLLAKEPGERTVKLVLDFHRQRQCKHIFMLERSFEIGMFL